MQFTTTYKYALIAPHQSIYYENSANAHLHLSFIKEINQVLTFFLFTLGLTQGQFCPTIFTDSFS